MINDEEFSKIIGEHQKIVEEYLTDNLYDFICFYISKGYELNIFTDEGIDTLVNSAKDAFLGYGSIIKIDNKKIENKLKKTSKMS